MLKFLLEKEFKQLLRGGMLPGILIMMPLMMMGLFPAAAASRQEFTVSELVQLTAGMANPCFWA